MSWLRLEDNMLDHPKWRRAIRSGGDVVVAVWVRLVSWCSRNLTDGVIPADMIEEVADVARKRDLAKALGGLVDGQLLALDCSGNGVIVDYLERNPSRESVLSERARRSESQRKRRHDSPVTGIHPTSEPDCSEVPSQSHPNPIPIPSQSHPIPSQYDPSLEGRSKTPARVAPEDASAGTLSPEFEKFPKGWRWSEATWARAVMVGVTSEELQEHVDYWTTHKFSRPVTNLDDELVRCLTKIRKRAETDRLKRHTDAPPAPRGRPAEDVAKEYGI